MFRTQGFVLLKRDFREHDRIYAIYTETHGKIEVLGRGTRKITSKLASHLEPPGLVDLFIVRGRVFDHVANAQRLRSYNNVRSDFNRALEFARVAVIFNKEVKLEQKDPHLYELLNDFLKRLEAEPRRAPQSDLGSDEGRRFDLEKLDTEALSNAFLTRLTAWTSYGKVI